jgi:hypothetical protein
MKKLIFLSFILTLFLVNLVSADMVSPGEKYIQYTFEIENLVDYSDHLFILYGEIGTREIIEIGQEFNFYKYSSPYIYAIKKTDFDLEKFEQLKEGDYKIMETYFATNPDLIKSDLQLNHYGVVSEFNPLDKAKDILRIEYLDDGSFLLVKDRVIYTYNDGMSETKSYSSSDVEPSRDVYLPSWTLSVVFLIGVLISLAALVTIIVLVVKKVRK